MSRPGITSERLVSLFLLGLLLLNPPLLSIFDIPKTAMGVPILYVYLFAAWAALVILMALTIESAAAADEVRESDAAAEAPEPDEQGDR